MRGVREMARSIGPVTVYPLRSAMHGAWNISTRRWGYACVKLPTFVFGRWWPGYFYLSPNGTPWASTLLLGGEYSQGEKMLAGVRRSAWGHGYSTEEHDPQNIAAYVSSIDPHLPSEARHEGWDALAPTDAEE